MHAGTNAGFRPGEKVTDACSCQLGLTERLRGSRVAEEDPKKEVNMRYIKFTTAATLAGALAVAVAARSAYGQYYYGPGFYAGNAYAFEPAPVVPAYPYAAPAYGFVYAPPPVCWNSTSDSRNYGYYGSCAYGAIDTDAEALGQARPNRRLVR
jgi:hypothetical protein